MGGNDSLSLGERADGAETAMRSLPPLFASLLAAGVAAAETTPAPSPEPAPKPPNVVLIVCDDLNDWVGCMGGHPLARTPNIDELAKRGVLFTNAHVPSPMSGPSRTAILTGEPDWRNRLQLQDPLHQRTYVNGTISLRDVYPRAVTLPQYFHANGYSTWSAGKIFHPKYDPASWEEEFVDQKFLPPAPATSHGVSDIPFDWRFTEVPRDQFAIHHEASWACEKLAVPHDKPFFMGVGIFAPHLPWDIPRSFDGIRMKPVDKLRPPYRADDLDDVPPAGRRLAFYRKAHEAIAANNLWDSAVQAYIAMVEFADYEVGRVIRALDAGPNRHETIVVLTSDNGFHLGEKSHWTKGTMWEESSRVPLIVAMPDRRNAGKRCARPVSLESLYPTLADLAGLPPNPRVEAKSIRPLVDDTDAPWDDPAIISLGPEIHAVRSERWRYIQYADGSEELYDHSVDPNEWTNLASRPESAAVLEEHRRHVPVTDFSPKLGPAAKIDPDAEELRGLWNVLFIAVDDMNDWVGCLGGHPDAKTPNIDRLAERGMLFTRAYCPAAICGPSRTAILSGAAPSLSGVWQYGSIDVRSMFPKDRLVTLPERFILHGYDSLKAGKVFHYPTDLASWTEYFHADGYPRPDPMPWSGLELESPYKEFDWGPVDAADSEFVDDRHISWLIDKLQAPRDKPLFLAAGLIRPHLPWHVPKRFFDQYELDEVDLPETIPDDLADVSATAKGFAAPTKEQDMIEASGNWREAVRGYLAAISFADHEVGRIVDALEASPGAGNTIIVLWSDHGQHLGEKHHWRKQTPWAESARVPFIVYVPGMASAGARCDRIVSLQDIYPTLMDLCRLRGPMPASGHSLVPLLVNPDIPWDYPAITSVTSTCNGIRRDKWSYMSYAKGTEELYDLEADPNEWRNLASDPAYAAILESFRRLVPTPFERLPPRWQTTVAGSGVMTLSPALPDYPPVGGRIAESPAPSPDQ